MPLSLGQALAELLATPETELRSACEDVLGGAKGLQRHHAALKRLDEEIERRSTKGFMEILNPLIDKILRTEAAMRSRSLILTSFLLRSANGPIVAKALITLLEAQDKRTKLAVVLLLEFFTSEMKLFVSKLQRGGWSPDKEEPGRSKPWVLLTLFWDGLVRILRQDGVFDDKQSARVETRLTTLTVHVAMEVLLLWCDAGSGNSCMGKAISSLDAGDTEEYETSDSFVITPEMIVDLLETLKLYRANSPLFCSTVDSAKAFVESSQIPIPMFKNMIKSLVRGAHPSVGLMALANFTSLLHKILSPSSDDASGGYFKLLGAAFAVGQRSKEDIDDILSSNPELEKAVLQLASLLSTSQTPEVAKLALAILGTAITVVRSDTAKLIVDPILALLDEDGVSNYENSPLVAAAAVLLEVASRDPEGTIVPIISRIGSDKAHRRKNALFLLLEMFRLRGWDQVKDSNVAHKLQHMLASRLICLIDDEDIVIRKHTAQLFQFTDPSASIPQLSFFLDNRSDRIRSSAELSLVSALRGAQMAEPGIVILMDHALSMSMGVAPTKPPKLPSDIGKNFSASSHSTTDSERFLRVAAIWAESVDPLEWPSLIPQVLRKVYSFPETAVYVKFVGKLAQYWETNKAAIAGLSTLAEIMGNQPTIADYSDVGDDDLRNLLLCRLSPLLMLKMMPLKTLAQMQTSVKLLPNSIVEATELTDPSDYIVPELINRIENSNEFDQVRKLACEVLGRLATSISPIIVQGLGQSLQNRNYDNARSYIYSCCCFIAAHGPDSAQSLSEWFLPVLDLFLLSLDGEPKLEAVLRGFLDLCSLCLAISARTGALAGTAKTKPLIETIPMEGPSDVPQPPHNTSKTNLEQFVLLVLSLLDPASEDWAATKLIFPAENNQRKYSVVEKRYAISTSMANILTMTVRRMTESMKDASVPSEEQSIFRKSLSWIGEIFGARLAFVVNKCCMDQSKDSAIPTAACLQALFNLMYELKEESSDVLDCIDISLKALLHGEAAVRLEALKLLGACVSAQSVREKAGPLKMLQVQRAVQGVVNLEADNGVQAIAQRLAESL